MKKFLLIFSIPLMVYILIFSTSSNLFASNSFGLIPYAGYGYYNIKYTAEGELKFLEDVVDEQFTDNFDADGNIWKVGVQLEIPIVSSLVFSPGVEYQQNSYKKRLVLTMLDVANAKIESDEVKELFLNIPLMLNFYLQEKNEGLFIGIGPKLAFNFSDEDKTISKNSMVVLAAANVGYQLPMGLRIAAFADLSLTDMTDLKNIDVKNICAGVIVGFRL